MFLSSASSHRPIQSSLKNVKTVQVIMRNLMELMCTCLHVIFGFCGIFSASKLKFFLSSNAVFNSHLYSSITFIIFNNVFGCSLKSIKIDLQRSSVLLMVS